MIFQDRIEAGQRLAKVVSKKLTGKGLVLGIPRGGVVVASLVAQRLNWPLDVLVTKKIGFPGNEELAIGAIAEDGEPVWDRQIIDSYGLSPEKLQSSLKIAQEKLRRYVGEFRQGRKLSVTKKVLLLIDDGIATGRTMEAGIGWLRSKAVGKIIIAVPVCSLDTARKLKALVDEWFCLHEATDLMAVGQFYRRFEQVSDEEVTALLKSSIV